LIKTLHCKLDSDTINLNGQFRLGAAFCYLPISFGKCKYTITVLQGKLRINHHSFSPDGGTWSYPPLNMQPQHYDLFEGNTYNIEIEANKSFNMLDRINVVNRSFTKPAKFDYFVLFN